MAALDELIDQFYALNYPKGPITTHVQRGRVPADMVVSGPYPNRMVEWKLVERCRGIDPGFDSFEAEIGYKLPESFKLWSSRYYTLDCHTDILSLPASPTDDPFGELRDWFFRAYRPEHLGQIGLIPFGDEAAGAGPLCFDARSSASGSSDWPILYVDHDSPPDEAIGPIIFSSFHKLLECCVHYLSGPGTDYWSRRERIPDFLELDPTGAGGPGQEYWETWIEDEEM